MPPEAFQIVQTAYEAFRRGDSNGILQLCTEDVDWGVETVSNVAPWYGIRHGHAGVEQFLTQVADALEILEFTQTTTVGHDEEVMTRIRFRARVRRTGRDISTNLMHYFKFREDRICLWRSSADVAQTEQALQTPQAHPPITHIASGPRGQMSGRLSGQMSGQLFRVENPARTARAAFANLLGTVREWRHGKTHNG